MATVTSKRKPNRITEDILQVAIKQIALRNSEPVASYDEVDELRLDYKDIKWIDNLWQLTSLTRLDLNNNLLERIQGLDDLVNLKWLNLSFNNINKMEGLESLEKLELLNLSNNRISVIENIDTLGKLTHFLFENNLLEKANMVLYLRKFKNLFTVNLSGNPATDEDNYRLFIAAYFPKLKFLDRRLLDEKIKNEASIRYNDDLEKLRMEELEIQQAEEAQQKQEAELQLHKDAFVEFLNGPDLFKSMFVDDPEAETLHRHAGIASLIQTFEHQMVALCMQLFESGLTEHTRRQTEESLFLTEQSEIKKDFHQKGSQILVKTFDKEQRKRLEEIEQLSDSDLIEVKIDQCNDEIDQLCKSLMTLEFQQVSQMEENLRKLDTSISEMVGNFSEAVQGIFSQCRDLEDDYFQKVKKVAMAIVAQVSKDNLDEEMPDDVVMLFTEQVVMDALTAGHDNHVTKINDRETQLVTRLTDWNVAFIKELKDKELVRNRLYISDIQRYKDYLREQLTTLQ